MIKDWDETQRVLANRPLRFTNPLVLAYWRAEVALHCAVSLRRLKGLCEERGCDLDKTITALETTNYE